MSVLEDGKMQQRRAEHVVADQLQILVRREPIRLRRHLARTLALCSALMASGSVSAAEPLSLSLRPCLSDPDLAICFLKLATAKGAGDLIAHDPELTVKPELLAQVGVKPPSVEALRRSEAKAALLLSDSITASEAASTSRKLDRDGGPPQDALAPILALPMRGAAPPLIGENPGSPRLLAFGLLVTEAPAPSPALIDMALAAWAAEVSRLFAANDPQADATALLEAYFARGDQAGVGRALSFERRPDARIELLSRAQRFESAARVAVELEPADVEPEIRRAAALDLRAQEDVEVMLASAASQAIEDILSQMTREGASERDVRKMRRLIRQQMNAESPASRLGTELEATIKTEAASRVSTVRRGLMQSAVRAGRPRDVHALADHLLAQRSPGKASDTVPGEVTLILRTATPQVADAWLTELESRTDAQDQISTLVEGWRAIGRPDKVEALIADLKLTAHAELRRAGPHPTADQLSYALLTLGWVDEARELGVAEATDLLRAEIVAGRGVGNLDNDLGKATTEGERISLLITCASESAFRRRFDDVLLCSRRHYEVLIAPAQRLALADSTLKYAGQAAAGDQLAASRALLDLSVVAAATGVAADSKLADLYDSAGKTPLIEIAKAELRASDRLPPRPKAEMMLGRAP